ncbi:MAG: hypothetical protein KA760_17945 [Steroidobacteraceae bacterium]|nr:hypothetical protein [Pseudomonadota bacterium]MBP7611383.1 hypothetical protein [Steroidobacteraceae bacterium]MBP9130529.1 hypothetical protein [Steroidobacteraceae bacterium]
MSLTLLLLAVNAATYFVVFRGLSETRSDLPVAARVALGALVVFGGLLASLWLACRPATVLAVAAGVAVGSAGLRGEGLAGMEQALGRYRFPLYLLAVATLAALVFVFVPITTFLTSPGEIGVHIDYLLKVNARDAMIAVYLAAVAYAFAFSPRMKTTLALLAVGALAVSLLYAFVLPFGYPKMTGLTFEQVPVPPTTRLLRVTLDLLVIAGAAVALKWLLQRFGGRPLLVAILLANVSLAVATGIGMSRDDVGGAGGPSSAEQLPDQPLRFSPSRPNTLIIFLDRFMGGYVEGIMAAEPALASRLAGFVWYPRTLAAGENSIAGVHPLYGGYDYTPVEMNARKKSLRDLSVEAFSILPYNFSQHGHRVNFVEPGGLGFTMAGDCNYLRMDGVFCSHIPPAVVKQHAQRMGFPLPELSRSSYADLLVLLASMRTAPYALKAVLNDKGPWRPFLDHSAGTTFKVWAELKAFESLSLTSAPEPNLNIISNILPHEPYYMGEDCLPQQQKFEVPNAEVARRGHPSLFSLQHEITARCTLLLVADYLDFLKRAGVYDNTEIVLVSDHGIVGPVVDKSSRALAGKTSDNVFVRSRSVLLVKKIGATGDLRVSEEFMPNAEVPRIVCERIGGCVNPFLANRPIAAFGRDDPFYVSLVPWQFSLQRPDAFVIHTQLMLKGKDPYNAANWAIIK